MAEFAQEVLPVNLEDEMRQSYLDYAMSVIIGRALPDVRDGLKPVHRRVLYAMHELSNDWNRPYKKSARVVGDVIGKYHPHGDTAVYDTIVRMAQTFSLRYVLIDGQGNFGSVDGDAPAAMRYTEVRMARIAHELLADLEKETVDFVANYDGTESEPSVLPTRVPNLLANGSTGIAVGMATNIPPHNLSELIDACIALIDDPEITLEGLMQHLPGPDFPTAGIINGAAGIREAYRTGRGRIRIRARCHIEINERNDRETIVATELPYQVNKARLLEKIAELVKDKRITGVAALRDESDKDGMRMVVEVKRDESGEVLLNNLYQHTQLEAVYGINMVALVDGQPRLLDLKSMLAAFVRHRREVVTRRTLFELRKARDRAHLLEGQSVALANIDEVIELIRSAMDPAEAKVGLLGRVWPPGQVTSMLARAGADASRPQGLGPEYGLTADGYRLSEAQAQSILDLRLHRLTGLEQEKIVNEYQEVLDQIAELIAILEDPDKLMQVIREELTVIKTQYGDERRTEIQIRQEDLSVEDLITEEDMVVTLSHAGYAKAQPLSTYATQHRGGRGKSATSFKEEDFIDKMFVANTHDTLLCFSSRGRVYWLKVYQLPAGSRTARGRPIVNLLPLEEGERISAVLPVRDYPEDRFVFFTTERGVVKKTSLSEYSRPRSTGIIAIDLREEDRLIGVALTDGSCDILLFNSAGKGARFNEGDVRAMGRGAAGVRGMRLAEEQRVVSLMIASGSMEDADSEPSLPNEKSGQPLQVSSNQVHQDSSAVESADVVGLPDECISDRPREVLTVTKNGYGKRTAINEYSVNNRGGQGVIAIQTGARNGELVAALELHQSDEVMLITNAGTLVRTTASEIPSLSRNTQGVRLIRLGEEEHVAEVVRIEGGADEDAAMTEEGVEESQ